MRAPAVGAATVLGGPTVVIDIGGLRIVVDPTFDAPGPHGYLTKVRGPAAVEADLGAVDVVLVSHDDHPDNLDDRGRAFALAAPLVLTGPAAAGRRRTAAAAAVLGAGIVIPAHYDGWTHFSETATDLVTAFDEAGLASSLQLRDHGAWVSLRP